MFIFSLKPYNTFGIRVFTEQLTLLRSETHLQQLLKKNLAQKEVLIIGEGSNILFTGDVDKLVLINKIKGISIDTLAEEYALVIGQGGENWQDFVVSCVAHGFGGLENLSLIPGTVGASPIQNIGAYGVELKDTFHSLTAIHLETGEKEIFQKEDCGFGYRKSVFKHELKGQYCITSVTFKLSRTKHKINAGYGAIQTVLEEKGIKEPTIKNIHEAVIQIRQSKLPDPAVLGNAGSFFKNPEITKALFEHIKQYFPGVPSYPGENNLIKIPAGWLIEQCGWKGIRHGNTGCYEKQALILVNYGNAKGAEIIKLAKEIVMSIENKFDITLEIEVNVI